MGQRTRSAKRRKRWNKVGWEKDPEEHQLFKSYNENTRSEEQFESSPSEAGGDGLKLKVQTVTEIVRSFFAFAQLQAGFLSAPLGRTQHEYVVLLGRTSPGLWTMATLLEDPPTTVLTLSIKHQGDLERAVLGWALKDLFRVSPQQMYRVQLWSFQSCYYLHFPWPKTFPQHSEIIIALSSAPNWCRFDVKVSFFLLRETEKQAIQMSKRKGKLRVVSFWAFLVENIADFVELLN